MTLHVETPEGACICPRCNRPVSEEEQREINAWFEAMDAAARSLSLKWPMAPAPKPSRWHLVRSGLADDHYYGVARIIYWILVAVVVAVTIESLWLAQQWLECWR